MNKKKSILLLTNKKSKKKILHLIKKYFKDFKINIKLFSNPNKKYNLKYKKKSLDYIINFNSYFILKKRHLNIAKNCCLNFHPAPPKYRGRGSINYALFNNDKKFGVTCHIIDEKIDHGPIINVMYFDVPKSSNVKKLFDLTKSKLFVLAKNTFKGMNSSSKYINKMLLINKKIKWSKKLSTTKDLNKLYEINAKSSKSIIKRKINATLYGKFKPYTKRNNKKIYYSKNINI